MDNLHKFTKQFRGWLIVMLLINDLIIIGSWFLASQKFNLNHLSLIAGLVGGPLILLFFLPWLITKRLVKPVSVLWQAVLHITPGSANIAAPDVESVKTGHDLVVGLTSQIYQLAASAESLNAHINKESANLIHNPIATSLPLPFFVLDKNKNIVFVNEAAIKYISLSNDELLNKNVYSVLDMTFQENPTLDNWLAEVGNSSVIASKTWDHAKLTVPNSKQVLRFDLAAYYNKGDPLGYEIMLILFDHNERYAKEEEVLDFVALAVHELRTPLTLVRGYIEALEEDLKDKLPPDDASLLNNLDASAQQLANFVNNVLNVARIEDDQFVVQLHEETWSAIVASAVTDMQLRAGVKGITIETDIKQNLPTVGVDRVSIYEVINNLLDNAIKYSGKGKKITLKSYLVDDGSVETTVTDYGIGIPESAIPNLFDKFYRNHRTRSEIGGTGLGLYLSKTIINAHGGHIWVRAKEDQGSTFGFTVVPYSKLSANQQGGQPDLTRTAHGWIKNHSMYRR